MTVSTKVIKAVFVATIALAGVGAAEWMSAPVPLSLVS
jgi:hypothetical protein